LIYFDLTVFVDDVFCCVNIQTPPISAAALNPPMIDFVKTDKPLLTTAEPVVIEEETEAQSSGLTGDWCCANFS
jgi:hypothetical protein